MLILLLGNCSDLILRLFYNQNTPIEYEPPGFKAACDELPGTFGRDLAIGSVSTRHHTMACQIHTKSGEVTAQEESTQNLISKLKGTVDQDNHQLDDIAEIPEPAERSKHGILSSEPQIQPPVLLASNTLPPSPVQSVEVTKPPKSHPTCVCERNLEDYELVFCQTCNQESHAICYGLNPNDDKSQFVCHNCCAMLPIEGDLVLNLDLQDLAMRRRAVMYLKHNNLPCARAGIALKIGEQG